MRYLILLMVLVLVSCGPVIVEQQDLDISDGWTYATALESTIDVDSKEKNYDLSLSINHSQDFAFQNLYVRITTTFPDGKDVVTPISLELSDKKGNWLGSCRSDCEISFYLKDHFKFENTGTHSFKIEQYSRTDELKGLNNISLILSESEKTS